MSTLILQLYSQNHWIADGSQTVWNFTFAGNPSSLTYMDRTHVKAYWEDESGTRTDYTFSDGDFLGDYQLNVIPAPPAGMLFVIYRDTPKDAPLVDFADGAPQSEVSLDDVAKQAVFIAAETLDNSGLYPDLGFKALKQIPYTGVSALSVHDNGKSHYKTDGTAVSVPTTLPVTYLTTIINNSASTLAVSFDGAVVGRRQGREDLVGVDTFNIPAYNSVGMTRVDAASWFISGYIT